MKGKIKNFLYSLVLKERSPQKLSRSISIALYLSFSPWIGMQFPLVFILSWALKLNTAVLAATAFAISNPWTYVPICAFDYAIGYWLLHGLLKLNVAAINPSWMGFINDYLYRMLGISNASLWAFIVGGNIVGLTLAFASYPLTRAFFKRLIKEHREDSRPK